jgi:hypothetical protein
MNDVRLDKFLFLLARLLGVQLSSVSGMVPQAFSHLSPRLGSTRSLSLAHADFQRCPLIQA